jgi:Ca2+-binding RTX toxin-like protein
MAQINPIIGSNSGYNSGTITVDGDDSNSLYYQNRGKIQIESGGKLTNIRDSDGGYLFNNGGKLINYGTFINSSNGEFYNSQNSTLTNSGTLTNNYTLYNSENSTLTNSGTLTNNYTLYNSENSTLTNSGTLTNNYTLYNSYGSTLTNSGTLTTNNGLYNSQNSTLTNNGTLTNNNYLYNQSGSTLTNSSTGTINNNATFNNEGTFNNYGTLAGTGAFYGLLSGGTVSPGNSSDADATFTVNGAFNLGNLKTTFSGTDIGDYDFLKVNGAANLLSSGSLSFSFDEAGLKNHILEGQTKTITFLQSTTGLTNSLNLASFTPTDDGDNGADFDFALKQLGNNLVLDITRLSSNTAPTTSGISDVTVQEDAPDTVIELFPAFADAQSPDAGLTYAVHDKTNSGLFSSTTIDATTGKLTLDYAANANGTSKVTVRATDQGGLSVDTTFGVTVNPVNDAPALTGTKATLAAGTEDTPYTIRARDLLIGFSDIDGDSLSVTDDLTASNGTLGAYDAITGTWSFNPIANYNGSVNLNYNVTDDNGGSKAATQSFTLAAVNDAPTATNDLVSTSRGTAVTIDLKGKVSDIEGLEGATLAKVDEGNGTVTSIDSPDRLITFKPNDAFVGTTSFTYTITDAGGLTSNTATVTVNVGGIYSVGNGTDNAIGNDGNDSISGDNGKDTITGLGGADTLRGNNGVDTIYGGEGDDLIWGGNGSDLLKGEGGRDKFVLAKGAGTDTITDFVAGTDLIGLSGGMSFSSVSLSGSNILLTSSNEILATLTGVNTSTLGAANFVTI